MLIILLGLQYKATDYVVPGAAKAEIVLTTPGGKETRLEVFNFQDGGVIMGMYNTDEVCGIMQVFA